MSLLQNTQENKTAIEKLYFGLEVILNWIYGIIYALCQVPKASFYFSK